MKLILDTNIALNLWFFKDPATLAALAKVLDSAALYGTPAMLTELLRVARSPHLSAYASSPTALQDLERSWRSAVTCLDPDATARSPLRCRDADDQIFLDLAQHIGATAILTLDRDLLKLSKRAKTLGLHIGTPAAAFLAVI